MNFQEAKEKVMLTLLGLFVSCFVWLTYSVTILNTNVALVVQTVGQHHSEIQDIKTELKELRDK